MGEIPSPVNVEDPQVQAHFRDFSGESDPGHLDNLLRSLPKHRTVFEAANITPRVELSEDNSPYLIVDSLRQIPESERQAIREAVPWEIEFRTLTISI